MSEPADALTPTTHPLAETRAWLAALERDVTAAGKMLRGVEGPPSPADLKNWEAVLARLADENLQTLGLPVLQERLAELRSWAATAVAGVHQDLRRTVLDDFVARAEARQTPARWQHDDPPTYLVGTISVAFDFQQQQTELLFGREPIQRLGLDVEAVLQARDDQARALREGPDAPTVFARLLRAWRIAVTWQGLPEGERVDLVDLLPALALVSQTPEALRGRQAGTLEYPRHRLAHHIWLLRHAQLLEHQGMRLDLGAATGGSTRNKRNVLYVPTTPVDGQYYLSLRFVPA